MLFRRSEAHFTIIGAQFLPPDEKWRQILSASRQFVFYRQGKEIFFRVNTHGKLLTTVHGILAPWILLARTPHALGGFFVASGIKPGPSGSKLYAINTRVSRAIN